MIVVDTVTNGPADGVLVPSETQQVVGGDVILALDGVPIGSTADLSTYLAFGTFPGDEVTVRLRREGSERSATVTVGVRPPPS